MPPTKASQSAVLRKYVNEFRSNIFSEDSKIFFCLLCEKVVPDIDDLKDEKCESRHCLQEDIKIDKTEDLAHQVLLQEQFEGMQQQRQQGRRTGYIPVQRVGQDARKLSADEIVQFQHLLHSHHEMNHCSGRPQTNDSPQSAPQSYVNRTSPPVQQLNNVIIPQPARGFGNSQNSAAEINHVNQGPVLSNQLNSSENVLMRRQQQGNNAPAHANVASDATPRISEPCVTSVVLANGDATQRHQQLASFLSSLGLTPSAAVPYQSQGSTAAPSIGSSVAQRMTNVRRAPYRVYSLLPRMQRNLVNNLSLIIRSRLEAQNRRNISESNTARETNQ